MSWKEEIKKNTSWENRQTEWHKQIDRSRELLGKIKFIWRTEVEGLDLDDIGSLSRYLVEYANLPVGDDNQSGTSEWKLLKYSEELEDLYNKMEHLLKVKLSVILDDMGM